jgi:hypothetical protein
MAIAIHLPGTGADLILRTEEKSGWCRCFISNRDEHLIGGQPGKLRDPPSAGCSR